jgi:hypothetical protein
MNEDTHFSFIGGYENYTRAEYYICIARPHLNIRAEPKISADRVGKLLFGGRALILSHLSNGWKKIAYRGGCAYTSGRWLSPWWWQAWPTDFEVITQKFGERPEVYSKYGLPGHEGLDIRAPFGTSIYSVNDGTVYRITDKTAAGKPSNYGWHVRVIHDNNIRAIYAHLAEDEHLPEMHQRVKANHRIGTSGATGNVWPQGESGAHLHLTLKDDNGLAGWPYRIINPSLYSDLWFASSLVEEHFS